MHTIVSSDRSSNVRVVVYPGDSTPSLLIASPPGESTLLGQPLRRHYRPDTLRPRPSERRAQDLLARTARQESAEDPSPAQVRSRSTHVQGVRQTLHRGKQGWRRGTLG